MSFQDNLRKYRKLAGLTAKDLAAQIDIRYGTYVSYETAGKEPKLETLCKIAAALHVSIDELLGHRPHCATKEEMSLDEAIRHADEVAREKAECQCGREHEQLAVWLRELRAWRRMRAELLRAQREIKWICEAGGR